jgi:hypothetical protein
MSVATAVAATLALSGLLALVVVRAPRIGVGKHQRASLVVAVLGAVVATATLAILIAAPLIYGARSEWWPSLLTNYFLAMAHRTVDGPYPFFWTPYWMYQVGSLTPMIAFGAFLALGAGYSARRLARRTALVVVTVACCFLAAYVVAGVYAVATTWSGVGL